MPESTSVIHTLVLRAVDQINREFPPGVQIGTDRDTVLLGRGAAIDSMALVSLIVAIEEELLDELDLSVTLANEKAMSMERSPFKTLGTLIDYVQQVVEEAGDG